MKSIFRRLFRILYGWKLNGLKALYRCRKIVLDSDLALISEGEAEAEGRD